jgi:hypothetical protein
MGEPNIGNTLPLLFSGVMRVRFLVAIVNRRILWGHAILKVRA